MDFKTFAQFILIKQTLFALPFAWTGIIFAGGGSFKQWLLVTLALFCARTTGMAFNRVLDAAIDAKNPRTSERLIPAGKVTAKQGWLLAVLSSAGLVITSFFLNTLVFYLSFAALFLLFTYSLFKRFSSSSHFYLGLVEAAAPVGGYLAISGSFTLLPFLLGAAILFWISGLDIIYALQDREFDKKERLHSIPVRFGKHGALYISRISYICAVVSLAAAGNMAGFNNLYWAGISIAAILLTTQQILIMQSDSQKNIKKIFFINQFISIILFTGCVVEQIISLYSL